MNNRKAKLLVAEQGQRIRITNRLVVRYVLCGNVGFPSHYYGIKKSPSAAQNRTRNHMKYFSFGKGGDA